MVADSGGGFTPVRRDEVDDHGILPRRVDNLARDVRALIDLVERKVLPALDRIATHIDQLERADADLVRRVYDIDDRISSSMGG